MAIQLVYSGTAYAAQEKAKNVAYQTSSGLTENFEVTEHFTSSLPILVLSPVEKNIARITIYDNHDHPNSLRSETATGSLDVVLSRDGERQGAGKNSYFIDLPPAKAENAASMTLMGLPAAKQWRLQGNLRDKGMLRNGLAYKIGQIIFPNDTPKFRYCELLLLINDTYYYEGIHLFSESFIQKFSARSKEDEDILVGYFPNNDKRRNKAGNSNIFGYTSQERGFSTLYIKADDPKALEGHTEMKLDKLESTLAAVQPTRFLSYTSLLDHKSLIDLYLLNTILLNEQTFGIPFALEMDKKDRFRAIPIWDFNNSLDSAPTRKTPLPFEVEPELPEQPSMLARKTPIWRQLEEGTTFEDLRLYPLYQAMGGKKFLWFDRLFLSRSFLVDLHSRYHGFRDGPLATKALVDMVDALADELGLALERDWLRWEKEYTATSGALALLPYVDNEEDESFTRQTFSYDQELVKIRFCLKKQDTFMLEQIAQTEWMSAGLYDKKVSGHLNAGAALFALFGFLLLTHVLTRKL